MSQLIWTIAVNQHICGVARCKGSVLCQRPAIVNHLWFRAMTNCFQDLWYIGVKTLCVLSIVIDDIAIIAGRCLFDTVAKKYHSAVDVH